ncbi:unnamed protein product [Durusdinium trenchii]|uniref:CSD domain-containing protein n=1 Tax=Durusdinium trenchii TaxID=1381693 RepID=A0ABP0ILM5_9DINO
MASTILNTENAHSNASNASQCFPCIWPNSAALGPGDRLTKLSETARSRMPTGVLVRWNNEKGFGFIQPQDNSEDVFCHVSDLQDGEGSVQEGDYVLYSEKWDNRKGKYRAAEVELSAPGELAEISAIRRRRKETRDREGRDREGRDRQGRDKSRGRSNDRGDRDRDRAKGDSTATKGHDGDRGERRRRSKSKERSRSSRRKRSRSSSSK